MSIDEPRMHVDSANAGSHRWTCSSSFLNLGIKSRHPVSAEPGHVAVHVRYGQ